eukprot:scaffold138283_cov32-Tisochrysis_lutea.AAC.1
MDGLLPDVVSRDEIAGAVPEGSEQDIQENAQEFKGRTRLTREDGPSCGSLLDAISTARFQQRLVALVGEKEGLSHRVVGLEQKLKRADTLLQGALDDKEDLQAALRGAERKLQEAEAVSERNQACLDAENKRYDLLVRVADDQAAESSRRIGEQAQEIHALSEQLSAANSTMSSFHTLQKSSEELIDSFHKKVAEVSHLLEHVRQAEAICRSTMVRVAEEQRSLRAQLSALEHAQLSSNHAGNLHLLVKEAREATTEKQALVDQKIKELDGVKQQLILSEEGREGAITSMKELQRINRHHEELLQKRDELLNEQCRQVEGLLSKNLLLTETNGRLCGELRQKRAVIHLLLREIGHADALAHSADRLAEVNSRTETAELAATQVQLLLLQDELRASETARVRLRVAHADAAAQLALAQDELRQRPSCMKEDGLREQAPKSTYKIDEGAGGNSNDMTQSVPLVQGSESGAWMVTRSDASPSTHDLNRSSDSARQEASTNDRDSQPCKPEYQDDVALETLVLAQQGADRGSHLQSAKCAWCADVLFGVVEYCNGCNKPFHTACANQKRPRKTLTVAVAAAGVDYLFASCCDTGLDEQAGQGGAASEIVNLEIGATSPLLLPSSIARWCELELADDAWGAVASAGMGGKQIVVAAPRRACLHRKM